MCEITPLNLHSFSFFINLSLNMYPNKEITIWSEISKRGKTRILSCFIPYSKAIFGCYPRCFLISHYCIPVLYNEGHLFWVLVLKGLVGLHRTVQFQLLQSTGRGIGLDYCDMEWFALETNRDHSVVFEIASKYCISDSFVDHDGYSISSKG